MRQITLRLDDDLADRLRSVADERGTSVNALASVVLRAAVDPEAAGSEIERVRERLARAGLLARPEPVQSPPGHRAVARARARAGRGTRLSDLISEDRR
jgi:predicted transcriptional regulator